MFLRDVRCVLKGSVFEIDTPWAISSWLTLCYGTYAVYSRGVLFEQTFLGASPQGGRCVVNRTLCSPRKYFLNRHSLGHLLIVDAVLSLGHIFMADAVLWDGRCVLKGSILE